MKSCFLKRGYPKDEMMKEMIKVKLFMIWTTKKITKSVPLLVTYQPVFQKTNDQKINKYLYLREFKKVFTVKLMFFPEVSENWVHIFGFIRNSIFHFSLSCFGQNYDSSLKVSQKLLCVIFKCNIISAWYVPLSAVFIDFIT